MKFDVKRVLEYAEGFAFPRLPQTEGERHAANRFANELERAGWRAEFTVLPARPAPMTGANIVGALLIVLGGVLGFAMRRRGLATAGVLVAGTWGLALVAIYGVGGWRRSRSPHSPSHNVIASRGAEAASTLRVVLCTPLAELSWRWPDNRTGIALLLELARTLSQSIQDRVEVRLVGVGGPHGIGINSLIRSIRRGWPDKPTLLIVVLAPGHGAEIVVEGRGMGLRMTRQAASDLWVPIRLRWSGHWPALRYGDATVAFVSHRRESAIEPTSLQAVAQLVQELVLRWGKTHFDTYRLARSSQNPG